jgi:hypothetical protein
LAATQQVPSRKEEVMNLSKVLWVLGSMIGAQQAVKVARRLEVDDLFGLVGLQRRRSAAQMILPAIGLVSLGAAVGAGTALLVAPCTGADLRRRLSERVDKLTDKLNEMQNHQPSASNPTHESQV